MELIRTEILRLTEEEKKILNNAFYILNQINEETTDYDLSILTEKLIDDLARLENYYE